MTVLVDIPIPSDSVGDGIREDALDLIASATDLVRESWGFDECRRGPVGDLSLGDVLTYDVHRDLVTDRVLGVMEACARLCDSLGPEIRRSVLGDGDSVRVSANPDVDTSAGSCAVGVLYWAVSAFGEVGNSDLNALVLDVRRLLASLADLLSGDFDSEWCVGDSTGDAGSGT